MKNIIILLTTILLSTTGVNSEENKKLPDDCYAEYKDISHYFRMSN